MMRKLKISIILKEEKVETVGQKFEHFKVCRIITNRSRNEHQIRDTLIRIKWIDSMWR